MDPLSAFSKTISPSRLCDIYFTLETDCLYKHGFQSGSTCYISNRLDDLPVLFVWDIRRSIEFIQPSGSLDLHNHLMKVIDRAYLWERWVREESCVMLAFGENRDLAIDYIRRDNYLAIYRDRFWRIYEAEYVSYGEAMEFMENNFEKFKDDAYCYDKLADALCRYLGIETREEYLARN